MVGIDVHELQLTSRDGTSIRAGRWDPEAECRANVLLIHGLAEHLGRYQTIGQLLSQAGFRVTGLELRGHGQSAGKRGFVRSWSDYVDDARAAAQTIEGPYFILAHSMGGLVALDHLRTASSVLGLVGIAPLLGVAVEAPGWKILAAKLLSWVLPSLPMANELDSKTLCTDPAVVAAYEQDPLIFSVITPRWYTEMLKAIARVRGHAAQYQVPFLALWGSGDVIVSQAAIEEFTEAYGGAVEKRGYDGLLHEILNEPSGEAIVAEIVAWCGTILSDAGSQAA